MRRNISGVVNLLFLGRPQGRSLDVLLAIKQVEGISLNRVSEESTVENCIDKAKIGDYNFLIVDIPASERASINKIGLFTTQHPDIPVILTCSETNPDLVNTAVQHDIHDLITYEEIPKNLLKTITFALARNKKIIWQRAENRQYLLNARKYRQISDNSRDLVCILNPELFITYISPSVKKTLGYEIDELLYENMFQVFCPEAIERLRLSSANGERVTDEKKYHYRVRHKNGKFIWLETVLKKITGAQGEVQLLTTSKNITRRKKNMVMMDEMQQLVKVGGWEYNIEKNQFYATREIAKIFGVPQNINTSFRKVLNFFTTESQKIIKREIKQAFSYGKSWDLELSFVHPNGKTRWVRTLGRSYTKNGKPYKIGGTLQDISERINYEELLLSKQIELKAFVENTPAAIAMFDRNMNYIAASHRWYDDYKLHEKKVIGENHYSLFPKTPAKWKEIHKRSLRGAVEIREEHKIVSAKGAIRWFRWEVRPWRDLTGNIRGIIVLTEEITQRKLVEETIKAQEKRMRKIYQITSDISGELEDRIKKIIKNSTKFLGMDYGLLVSVKGERARVIEASETVPGFGPGSSYNLDTSIGVVTYTKDAIVAIPRIQEPERILNPALRMHKIEAYIGVPIYVSGTKYGILGFYASSPVKNFTQADKDFVQIIGQWIGGAIDRKRYQRELVMAKEKAEEASRAKANFLSTMSHEIRTPLNAVVGLTHLLLDGNPLPAQIKNLKTLQFSANNLLALINDILDFSKIESEKIEIENIDYNLQDVLEGLHNMFEFKAREKDITLEFKQADNLPVHINGDPVRLNQILSNLLSNAIKFTETGGVVMSINYVASPGGGRTLQFQVADSGIGIPGDKLAAIFESFTQAGPDTTRKYGGTGLGLAISKKLAEMQNGQISVTSTVGTGTTFTLDLPVRITSGPKEDMGSSLTSHQVLESLYVLLVEDNEVNQLVALQFLHKKQVKVETATSGHEALKKLKKIKYDLILMDLQMPGMDGFETARKIRAMKGAYYQDLPIIALSATPRIEVQKSLEKAGINGFISKPFVPADFYNTLARYARKPATGKKVTRDMASGQYHPRFGRLMEISSSEKTFYLKMLRKMQEEIIGFIPVFFRAVNKKDAKSLGFIKHKITSTLIILDLQDLLKDIEMTGKILRRKEQSENVKELSGKILRHVNQVIKEIRQELNRFAVKA